MSPLLPNATEIEITSRGTRWMQAWYPPGEAPCGRRNGSGGICVTDSGGMVVISNDQVEWDIPGGRPEGDEDWEATLRREVLEEACAVVQGATLLGFARGRHVEGPEAGSMLVRSIWLAQVTLNDWRPQFEIKHRKVVPFEQAIAELLPEFAPLWERVFHDARLRS